MTCDRNSSRLSYLPLKVTEKRYVEMNKRIGILPHGILPAPKNDYHIDLKEERYGTSKH